MAKKKESIGPHFELNKLLDRKISLGMARTRAWNELWQESLRYFFSEQLGGKKRHKHWDWVVVNYIWPSAMQEIAKLSKNHPKIIAHSWEDSDTDVAETWQSALQWQWQKGINNQGMRLDQIAAILEGKLFGYRVCKIYWEDQCYWNDAEKKWVGDVKYRLWHPAQFWASDEEKIDDGDCGTVRYVELDWAIRKWPKFESQLKEEAAKFKKGSPWGKETIRGSQSTGTTAALASGLYGGGTEADKKRTLTLLTSLIFGADKTAGEIAKDVDIVKIEETYLRDYETTNETIEKDIPEEELLFTGQITKSDGLYYDANGELIPTENWPKRVIRKYKEPKYPNGRVVVRCGKTILNPDDQRYLYSKWPFMVIPHYLLPHMWQGVNAVELYKLPQDIINISVSHLFNNMKLFGDPKIAVEEDAIAINPRTKKHFKIGSGAGQIIRLVRGALTRKKFQILQPPPVSAAAMLLYKLFSQEFKNLTGLQGIARGEQEKSRMTATEASHLAISSHDRIALQSVYEDEWVRQCAGRMAEIMQVNYDVGRFVRIVGEDRLAGITQITQRLKDVRFDVDVEPSSQLPFDEEKRQARYLQAYQLVGDPNPNPMLPDMLRILEISNWKKILADHPAWQQFMQFKQLYEMVRTGQMDPRQAVQMLVDRAMQEFAKEPVPPPKGGE